MHLVLDRGRLAQTLLLDILHYFNRFNVLICTEFRTTLQKHFQGKRTLENINPELRLFKCTRNLQIYLYLFTHNFTRGKTLYMNFSLKCTFLAHKAETYTTVP